MNRFVNLEYKGVPDINSCSVNYKPFYWEYKTGNIIYIKEPTNGK